jgi:hypothetical protein
VRRLAAEFGKSKDIDLAVVYTLGRMANSAAAETLATLEPQTADKDVKKEIRRAFFKLGQKWLEGIRFVEHDDPGFWETRGYHNHADPWAEERYG